MANVSNPKRQIQHLLQGAPHCKAPSYTVELCAGVAISVPPSPSSSRQTTPDVFLNIWLIFKGSLFGDVLRVLRHVDYVR